MINPINNDEDCFKWAVLAALHYEEVGNNPERISKLKPYVEQYNWGGLEFPMAIEKIGKFEKWNPEIAVNVLFASKQSIYIAHRSEYNAKRSKQANLLMVVDGENRHYTAIKYLSRTFEVAKRKTPRSTSLLHELLERFSQGVRERKALHVLLKS